jgi:hypothetical protein
MSKLTPSERTNIIAKHLSGQPDPEFDVIITKSGKYAASGLSEKVAYRCVRKRNGRSEHAEPVTSTEPVKFAEPDDRFDTCKLIEKMYQILTKDENTKNKHIITAVSQPEPELEPISKKDFEQHEPIQPKRRGRNLFGLP